MRTSIIAFAISAVSLFIAASSVNAQTTNANVITLSTKEFCEKVYDINAESLKYKGDKPAIVDFYADWCGPCRAIAPTLQTLAAAYGDKIVIYKVNIDNSPELAQAFGIQSIPAVMYIPLKGEPVMTSGSRDRGKFEKEIAAYLL